MPKTRTIPVASIVIAALLAGCGSSRSASTAASSQSASTPAKSSYAPAASNAASSTAAVVLTSKQTKLGTILGAGPMRLTVYLYEADKGSTSSCSGPCAAVWPPVTTAGNPSAAGMALAADLGTITRSDGTTQVTYKGHPLYYYAKDVRDGDAGDTYGQALKSFGADWYVLAPSGKKLDKA